MNFIAKVIGGFFFFFILSGQLFSQENPKVSDKKIYKHQFSLQVDNDVFISPTIDKYYSSGMYIYYRWLHKEDSEKKFVRSVSLNQIMYTPKNVTLTDFNDFDRPYASIYSVFLNQEKYTKKSYLSTKLELGWMGPATGIGTFHKNWHETFGFSPVKGWKFQIENTPVVNLHAMYAKPILQENNFDFTSESYASAGTIYNHLRQDFLIRIGLINPLDKSTHYQGKLGNIGLDKYDTEIYLFLKTGASFNLYNATIEGNLLGEKSIHTEDPINGVLHNEAGIKVNFGVLDASITLINLSKETSESTNHTYLSLMFNKRFK